MPRKLFTTNCSELPCMKIPEEFLSAVRVVDTTDQVHPMYGVSSAGPSPLHPELIRIKHPVRVGFCRIC